MVSFPGGSEGKESVCNVGDLGSIPVLGKTPRKGNGNLLQYSYLENPMDRGAWWATVHGVAKSWTRLSNFTSLMYTGGFPGGAGGKETSCQCRRLRFNPWIRRIPRSREWQPTPVFLPGKSHGQGSLAG